MASVCSSDCDKCGFNRPWITLGALMKTFKTHNYFPALCKTCGDMVQANIKPSPPVCTKCNGSDIVLYGPETRDPLDSHNYKGSLDGLHLCPSCRSYSLHFEHQNIMAD